MRQPTTKRIRPPRMTEDICIPTFTITFTISRISTAGSSAALSKILSINIYHPILSRVLFFHSYLYAGDPQGCRRYVRAAVMSRPLIVCLRFCSFFRYIISLHHFILFAGLQLHPVIEELLDIEGVTLIKVIRIFVVRMLGQIIFIRQKWPHAAQLQHTFAAVQDRDLITAHQFTATLSSDEFRFHIFSADHTSSAAQHLPLSVCTPIHAHAHANLCEIP